MPEIVFDELEISSRLNEGSETSAGDDCCFIDLGNGYAMKIFWEEFRCRESYTCQKWLAERDLAPNVVGKIITMLDQTDSSITYYCYVTEIIEPLVDYETQRISGSMEDDEYEELFCDNYRDERDEWIDKVENLTGCVYSDDHPGNFGIKNGEVMALDFDKFKPLYKAIVKGLV